MRRPGTDESNVQMADVLCDFCSREWTDELPMVEGHKGSCICGRCLSIAYAEVVLHGQPAGGDDYLCVLCLEGQRDRAALKRGGELGWRSPMREEAAICRRCIKQSAAVLQKDKELGWRKPEA